MTGEIRPGLLVVIVEHPLIREIAPHLIGQLFTVLSGPTLWHEGSDRVVWMMEEMIGCCSMHHYCFARDEFKPLPPPDELIAKAKEQEVLT